MNNLTTHIEYLLSSVDCVVIPGLGAVLAQSVSARYDSSVGVFLPPRRVYSFNCGLSDSDGLLISSVARAERVGYEAASRMVAEEVRSMRSALDAEGRLRLGRIGSLLRGEGGRILFEPAADDVSSALTPALAWLRSIDVKPIPHEEASAESGITLEALKAEARAKARRNMWISAARRIAAVAAVVVVFVGLSFVVTRPAGDARDDSAGQYASIVPATGNSAISRIMERPGATAPAMVLVLRHEPDAVTIVDTAALAAARKALESTATARIAEKAAPASSEKRFCLIVASLASKEEAERFIAAETSRNQAVGASLKLLRSGERFRVYAAEGKDAAEVRTQASTSGIDSLYPSAWICRK